MVGLESSWLKCRNGCIELMGGSHFFEAGGGSPNDVFVTFLSVSLGGWDGGFIDRHLRHMMFFVDVWDARFVIYIGVKSLRTEQRFLGGGFRNRADRDWDRRTLWIYGAGIIHAQSGRVGVGKMSCGWRLGGVGRICEGGRRNREVAGTCWMEAGNYVSTFK